ncbi:MAG: hypothetical protein HY662_02830, partial [Chloroflexi bacterium]|nr:hypothetical protein [Chloroflexota bacterium]
FFGLPDSLVLVAILPVGYPAGPIPPPRPRLARSEIVLEAKAEPVATTVA